MDAKSYLLIVVALLFGVLVGFFVGDGLATDVHNDVHAGLFVEPEEESWPIYLGYCFVFQAPEGVEVKSRFPRHLEIYKDDKKIVSFLPNERDRPLEGPEDYYDIGTLDIGGMSAHFSEKVNGRKFSGNVRIDTNLVTPSEIEASYEDLSEVRRNLALNVIRSVRLHEGYLRNRQRWAELGVNEMAEEPLSENTLTLPTTKRGEGTGCRLVSADMADYRRFTDL